MTRAQQLYNLIAECQAMTIREILTFTGWARFYVSEALQSLMRAQAIKVRNIGRRRHYVIT